MRRGRIFHDGRAVWAEISDCETVLRCADGTVVEVDDARWLPPVTSGATIFALGLNYADHNAELGFVAKQAKPLIFLKGHATLVGHKGNTPLPTDAKQMHPECELVAVIGKPARRIARTEALSYISGYTVANDYAVREYLENFYRPNARVKNRDSSTPLGPWIVDALDVGDPQSLSLKTSVNGVCVQEGSTADMVLDVAGLIEYLSSFMTLLPGDMILTGTPKGIRFVQPGDVVECVIDRVGRLVNVVEAAI